MDTGTTAITDIHLALIVILAVAAIAAIVWGMRLKRARRDAAERFAANQDETRDATEREQAELGADPLHADPPSPSPSSSQVQFQSQMRTAPIPVSPSLPPVADDPVPATPVDRSVFVDAPRDTVPLADDPTAAAVPASATSAGDGPPDPAAPAAAANPADRPVTALKGLGPKVASALADRGITTVGQIAALDTSQADALDAGLGAFQGRMARDRWIEQAQFLAAGDVKGFEAVFGRL